MLEEIKDMFEGFSWQSSGSGSMLPLHGVWVLSLVGELRSCMPHNVAPLPPQKTFEFPKHYNIWCFNTC